jgi:hypothetical protein
VAKCLKPAAPMMCGRTRLTASGGSVMVDLAKRAKQFIL